MFKTIATCLVIAVEFAGISVVRGVQPPAPSKTADAEAGQTKPKKNHSEAVAKRKSPSMELTKAGAYRAGLWQYELEVLNPGTRREARVGRLAYAGRQPRGAELNDYHNTPWGPMYWVGNPRGPGDHGWMPRPAEGAPRKGRLLPLPGSGPSRLELIEADNGRSVQVSAGGKMFIRLRGNPTTGFRWQLAEKPTGVLESSGDAEYTPDSQTTTALGAGGTFTFAFRAVRPGAAIVKLAYLRPWEKATPPAQAFTVTVEVTKPPERAIPERPAETKPAR